MRPSTLAILCLSFAVPALAQTPVTPSSPQTPPPVEETVEVVAITPVHGSGLPRRHIPANVQVVTRSPATEAVTDLGALLTRGLTTMQASEAQGGTYQPDVLYRGFTASPLLGASEGLAVYVDGVRANEPFGDIVNWDALPTGAVASVNVMPGASPLFGLNALGGAVSVRTRDGWGAPDGRLALSTGSFARHRADGELAAARGALSGFVAGSWLDEEGWRDHSPSSLRRLFAKGSARGRATTLDLTATLASNDLLGNGTAPELLLSQDRSAVFTHPDRTDHDLGALGLRLEHRLSTTLRLEATAYGRQARLATLNGDAGEDDDDDDHDGDEEDHAADEDDDDELEFDGALNRSRTRSRSGGALAQLVFTRPLAGRANHLVAGTSLDVAGSTFGFSSEFGTLSPTREAIGVGLIDEDSLVDLEADTRTASVFVGNTLDVVPTVHLTVSARANWSRVTLRDQLGDALDGDHVFQRVNPAAGLTWDVSPALNLFGGYAQASRVPTPVELTCADPEDPCRLPNAFVSDPPLDQPVAGTWEGGARGTLPRGTWSLAAFATGVRDDLIFVSSGRLRGSGHFENVARTRRRGVEAGLDWRTGPLSVSGSYTWQRATFGTDLRVPSFFHPDADDEELAVSEGSRLPGVPTHVGRVSVSSRVGRAGDVALQWRGQSSSFLRGDESNGLEPLEGFAVLDAQARWRVGRRFAITLQAVNLLDADYGTFGMLGDAEILGPAFEGAHRFRSPGMPRAAWVGLEFRR